MEKFAFRKRKISSTSLYQDLLQVHKLQLFHSWTFFFFLICYYLCIEKFALY